MAPSAASCQAALLLRPAGAEGRPPVAPLTAPRRPRGPRDPGHVHPRLGPGPHQGRGPLRHRALFDVCACRSNDPARLQTLDAARGR
eukprot:8928051-Alexandrium_andersonii.AAC.1